jgi:uncharacterized membrane protein (DUF485 family)
MSRFRYDWSAIAADSKFIDLQRRKRRFLALLMLVSVAYYFLLPVGAAYVSDLFTLRIAGEVNGGILFALSEFVVTLAVALIYVSKSNNDFDRVTQEIVCDANRDYRRTAGERV